MDIKAMIEELINKVKSDEALQAGFKADPEGTVKKLIGSELKLEPEKITEIVNAIKAKVAVDDVKGLLGGILSKK